MIYTLYDKAEQLGRAIHARDHATVVAVPETTANWALIAPPFWLMAHRLWWSLTFYGLFIVLTTLLLWTPLAPLTFFIAGLPGIYLWLEGWQLVRQRMELENMQLVAIVEGETEESAIARYLGELPKSRFDPIADSSTVGDFSREPVPAATYGASTATQLFGPLAAREV